MDTLTDHDYPTDPAEHLWGPWAQRTRAGLPQPVIQYRTCQHPHCGASEDREAPQGMTVKHAYRQADPTANPLCGATDATYGLEWRTDSVVLPPDVTCRQCRWIAGGGTGPAPERPDRLTHGVGHDGDLTNRFTYHPPTSEQPEVYELVRDLGHLFALLIQAATFPSQERDQAITEVEAAVMWTNAAIARRGLPELGLAGGAALVAHILVALHAVKPESLIADPDDDERIELARQALIRTGYFTPEQVGPDIAPRIIELWSAMQPEVWDTPGCGATHPRMTSVGACTERGRHTEHRGPMADEYGTIVTWTRS